MLHNSNRTIPGMEDVTLAPFLMTDPTVLGVSFYEQAEWLHNIFEICRSNTADDHNGKCFMSVKETMKSER